MRLRKTAPSDIPALKELWKAAFSEKDEDISDFFEMVYPTAMGFWRYWLAVRRNLIFLRKV